MASTDSSIDYGQMGADMGREVAISDYARGVRYNQAVASGAHDLAITKGVTLELTGANLQQFADAFDALYLRGMRRLTSEKGPALGELRALWQRLNDIYDSVISQEMRSGLHTGPGGESLTYLGGGYQLESFLGDFDTTISHVARALGADEAENEIPASKRLQALRSERRQLDERIADLARTLGDEHVNPGHPGRADEFPPDEWIHLVTVGSIKPGSGDGDAVDVWLKNDPVYAHVMLSQADYLDLLNAGEIERDAKTGYPRYTGSERLRG